MSRVQAERDWISKMCGALSVAEADSAETDYQDAFAALAPRIKRALSKDKSGNLNKALLKADDLAAAGNFAMAQQVLESAGAAATKVMSTADKALPAAKEEVWKTKDKGARYKDEEKKLGWRSETPGVNVSPESTAMVTHYARDEAEKESFLYDITEDGRIVHARTNTPLAEGSSGYVLREDRQLAVFNSSKGFFRFADGTEVQLTGQEANEQIMWKGQLITKLRSYVLQHGALVQQALPHHTTPVAGAAIAGGGDIQVKDGRIREISDQSGHYKPTGDMMHQTVKQLHGRGALVDNRLVDSHGETPADEDGNDMTAAVAAEARANAKQAQRLDAEIRKLQAQGADPKSYQNKVDELENFKNFFREYELDDLGRGLDAHRVAKVRLVGKTGLSADEFDKVRGNPAKILELLTKKYVAAYGAKHPALDGPELRGVIAQYKDSLELLNMVAGMHLTKLMTAEQYLQTEGNEAAIRRKDQVNAEIERKAGGARQREHETATVLFNKVQELGGDPAFAALKLIPDKMSLQQKYDVLTGAIPHQTLWPQHGFPEVKKPSRPAPTAAEGSYDPDGYDADGVQRQKAAGGVPAEEKVAYVAKLAGMDDEDDRPPVAPPAEKPAPKRETPAAAPLPRPRGAAPPPPKSAAPPPVKKDSYDTPPAEVGDGDDLSEVSDDDPSEDEPAPPVHSNPLRAGRPETGSYAAQVRDSDEAPEVPAVSDDDISEDFPSEDDVSEDDSLAG